MLRCMTRRRENFNLYVANGQRIAISNRLMIELEARIGASHDARARQRSQLAAAAHEIVVDVCLEDVGYAHTFGTRGGHALIDVAQWIDQRCSTAGLRNQQMRAVTQAFINKLAYPHCYASFVPGILIPLTRM